MKPLNALHLYRVRLRARFAQELLAVVGIAAGVALLFASQVSSASLRSSVAQLSHGIAGAATLQLVARGPEGMAESTIAQVRAIAGVRVAAPVLEAGANVIGPKGSASAQLIGADGSLSRLGGTLVRGSSLKPFAGIGAVVLPAPLAAAVGVHRFGQEVHFQLAGRTAELPLYATLGERRIGPLAGSAIAIVPLATAQEMTGLGGRVSRILVESAGGAQAHVRAALARMAGEHLTVESIDYEQALFANAAAASEQSSALFATISALVGFLFAFNAMLLTVPQRRRLALDLRRDGYRPRTVACVLALDALVLGVVACAAGLVLGEELSIHVLHSDPSFLSLAFAVGTQRTADWQSVAIALAGGMLAALVAVIGPLRDVLAHERTAVRTPRVHVDVARGSSWLALGGLACAGAATLILLAAPDAAIPGMVALVASLLLVLPAVLGATLALVQRVARMRVGASAHVAAMELGSAAARAVAVMATGAIAIFGSVAIDGAHGDLLRGLDGAARETNALADVWVYPAGAYDLLATASFRPHDTARLRRLTGVAAVNVYRGGLLDLGARRVLVLAPDPRSRAPLVPAAQIVAGDAATAERRVRAGGWAVLSRALADERHLSIGEKLTLPAPTPIAVRIAALSTNVGWAPGAVVMNGSDYARAWGGADASAYAVQLDAGFATARAAREISASLGPGSGMTVRSAHARAAAQSALTRQALARLAQIATLIPLVAVLAMAAAMGAMIWQRRPRLAKLRLDGLSRVWLWRTILLESALLVAAGCLTGAVFGVYAQQLADRALAQTINFPVAHSLAVTSAVSSLLLMIVTGVGVLAIPGYLAASVPASLALAE